MSLYSISALNELTGIDRRTIKKRLENLTPVIDGSSHKYETKQALPLLYGVDDGEYDLTEERARLAHHQANKTSLEEQVLKGDLIPAEEVLSKWEKMVSNFRAKMLAIPTKTSHLLINVGEFDEVESILKTQVYEALKELSNEGNR
ncbi:MAG: hypothetical protein GY694_07755 [Gammaproteobacteria bacterium]|nr:hypothetical protein [Gammaproteobacteria bacterium]